MNTLTDTYVGVCIIPAPAKTTASIHPDGDITCIEFAGGVARLQFHSQADALNWLDHCYAAVLDAMVASAATTPVPA